MKSAKVVLGLVTSSSPTKQAITPPRQRRGISLPRGILQAGDTEPLNRRGIPRLFLKADVNPLWFCFGRRLLFRSCGHDFLPEPPQHSAVPGTREWLSGMQPCAMPLEPKWGEANARASRPRRQTGERSGGGFGPWATAHERAAAESSQTAAE
jgi:hypothetical protein